MKTWLTSKEYRVYRIICALAAPFTRKEIAAQIDLPENTISTYLSMLRRKGKIERTGEWRRYSAGTGGGYREYKRATTATRPHLHTCPDCSGVSRCGNCQCTKPEVSPCGCLERQWGRV